MYEGSDNDDDKAKTVSEINQNNHNNYNVVSNSKSDDKAKGNLFDKDTNEEVEATPKTIVNAKVVQAMKSCKSHNANKIVKGAAQEKSAEDM